MSVSSRNSNREALILVEKLCIKFGQITNKLTEIRAKKAILEETVNDTRASKLKEKEKLEEKVENIYNEINEKEQLLERQGNFSPRDNPFSNSSNSNFSMRESEKIEQFEILRSRLNGLKESNNRRISAVRKDEQTIFDLKHKEEILKKSISEEKENVEELREKVKMISDRIEHEIYENNIEIDAVKSTKHDYRKMLSRTVSFKKKIEKLEKEMTKKFENFEKKKDRMKTLKKLNKSLRKKQGHRLELEKRYTGLSEQSLNLQYLISEAMKNLTKKFKIEDKVNYSVKSSFVQEQQSRDSAGQDGDRNKKEVYQNQLEYIAQLEDVVISRESELGEMRRSTKALMSGE